MEYVTTVRVLVKETRQPLADVPLALFDRDEQSNDDPLGCGLTNRFGEVMLRYETKDFVDGLIGGDEARIGMGGGRDSVPDLYVVLYDKNDKPILSTRDEATINKAAEHLLVLIDEELAKRSGLMAD